LHTEEEKRKISESMKEWVKKHPEHIEKLREINRKRKHTSETKAKISKSKLSDKNPAKRPDVRKTISATLREKYRSGKIKPPKLSPEVKLMSSIRMRRNNPMKNPETVRRVFETRRRKGIKGSFHYLKENDPEKFEELCNNSSERMRKNNPMKDPKVAAKSFSNSSRQPNRLEKALEELVHPYGFVYSGDGSFFIPVNTTEKKIVIPDFVNKEEKKVIEVCGSYWHNPDEMEERTELYAKLGWDCLVVWDYELKNRNFLLEKITRFANKGKIPKTLIGKRFDELSEADKLAILGKADVCWFCNKVFIEREATYDPETDTLKCPYCQKSFKDLPPLTQQVLDAEMISLGLWPAPWHNLPRRKKRSSNVIRGVTREDFLTFCEHYYKDWLNDYRAGRISFEELQDKVERQTGLIWVFR
jgi:G:T-mismatch repair DNA endonuclease (very short patch repair protein)